MRLFVILLLLMPLLTGCETVQKGIKEITSKLDPDAPRPKPEPTRSAEDLLAAAGRLMDTNEYVPAIDIHNSIPESAPAPIREIGAGRTPEEALRRTKIAYVDHPQYAHPFYWSSLVITGDGARLNSILVNSLGGSTRSLSIWVTSWATDRRWRLARCFSLRCRPSGNPLILSVAILCLQSSSIMEAHGRICL